MMELRHLAMVNWHLFDIEDIEVGGHIGVLGENRSGKSTVLDMMQVVLTGANRKYQRLNAVAGDSTKGRGGSPKRSVAGYCLGTLGEDQTRRDEARSYIVLGFEDSSGERPPVTVGLAIEARKSESSETVLARFVAIGSILKAEQFIETRGGRKYPAQWDDVRERIVAMVGVDNFVNHRDRPGDYVREYMRHLVPHAPYVGEQNAAALQKAIVNSMTLNQNYTATEFVRRFILEENPIGIGELRESIRTYRNISATIQKMREKLDALKALRMILVELDEVLDRIFREQWVSRRAEWLAARAHNRDMKQRLREEKEKREAAANEIRFLEEELADIEKEIERLRNAIAEYDAKSGRQGHLRALESARDAAARAAADFGKRRTAARNLQPILALKGFGFDQHIPGIERLCHLADGAKPGLVPDALAEAEQVVLAAAEPISACIDELRQKLFRKSDEQREELAKLRQRIQLGAAGHSSAYLEPATQSLCQKLRQIGMAPRVLCDLVEITDPKWTFAAEALLRRDREAVFVDREDIATATATFKEGRRDFQGASLVSLNKLDQYRDAPRPGTFPSIFRSEDLDALAFLMRRYGNVRLATTLAEFDAPGRAIMQDGLYDDGLIRTHRTMASRDFKIGKGAQANLLRQLADEADDLERRVTATKATADAVDLAHRALRLLLDDSSSLSVLSNAYHRAQAEISESNRQIAAIDGADDGGLRQRFRAQLDLKQTRSNERTVQQGNYTKPDREIFNLERRLGDAENMPGSDLNTKVAWSIFKEGLALYNTNKGRSAYRQLLDQRRNKTEADRHKAIAAKASEEAAAAEQARQNVDRRARLALKDYFERFGVSSQVGAESHLLKEVKPWMDQIILDIESNELRRYERQAREAADKAGMLLRGEFINALTARINRMEREITSLNRNLQEHPFHGERYSFHRTAVAEFQPVLKIVDIGKTAPEALDMLFRGDAPDDFPHRDTIKALEALLEDPEKDFSEFEDYRNFYTFEIHMEDVETGRKTRWETRRGTGSGAEQQVPIYVAIGASLASVYGSAQSRSDKSSGIALAIFDEAFSKMDGTNQRQMMRFYKDLGLQIVIAAPFEKRVAVLEHMETIVEIDRIGEQSKATVVQLKERARRELAAINPEFMTDEQLSSRLAAE